MTTCSAATRLKNAAAASAVLALVPLTASVANAQAPGSREPPEADSSAESPASPSVCLGFMFSSWSPALDWGAAGHAGTAGNARVQEAPEGRGWATPLGTTSSDSTMILTPPWWPAGVVVALPAGPLAHGDTVVGRATALIADGRLASPSARVRAWRVPCTAGEGE